MCVIQATPTRRFKLVVLGLSIRTFMLEEHFSLVRRESIEVKLPHFYVISIFVLELYERLSSTILFFEDTYPDILLRRIIRMICEKNIFNVPPLHMAIFLNPVILAKE